MSSRGEFEGVADKEASVSTQKENILANLMVPAMIIGIGLMQSEHKNIQQVGVGLFVASWFLPIASRILREHPISKNEVAK